MSLILDALRKMELERKARRQSSPEIRAEVLNYRGNPTPHKKSLLLPVVAGLFIVAAAAASFFYFNGAGSPRREPSTTVEPATAASPAIPPVTSAPPVPLVPTPTVQPTATSRKAEAAVPAENGHVVRNTGDDLSISGIAWQEERSLRRAVINGALMGEGEEILGAKIVEISENLVRFRRGGNNFEIAYPSGAGK